MSREAMLATETLVEHLQEYVRSGLGSTKTTELINPLLTELQELRQYLYKQPVSKERYREHN